MQKCEKRLPHIFPSSCTLESPHKHVGNLLISVIPGVSTLVWNHIKTLERSNRDISQLDSLNTSHDESNFTKSEIVADINDAEAELRQHCIHRANRWCNLRTTSIDEAISRLASEMQELETAINAVALHCNDTYQCLSSPCYGLELQTLILSLQEEAGDVYYGAHDIVYAYLYSALIKSTIQSWIINMFHAKHSTRYCEDSTRYPGEAPTSYVTFDYGGRDEHGYLIRDHENGDERDEDIPESIHCLKACSRKITQSPTDQPMGRVNTITTDTNTILQEHEIRRNGSLTHIDVLNLKIRALNKPNVQIHSGLKEWIVDGRLIDDADYAG